MAKEMSIGEVARRFGLSASALRYYEEQGLLPPARRKSGRRVYDASIVPRLSVIELAKAAGFTIREIGELLAGCTGEAAPGTVWREMAERKLAELQRSIEAAHRMQVILDRLLACDCPTLDACGVQVSTTGAAGDGL